MVVDVAEPEGDGKTGELPAPDDGVVDGDMPLRDVVSNVEGETEWAWRSCIIMDPRRPTGSNGGGT